MKLTMKLSLCQWLHFFHKIVEFLMDSKIIVNDIHISKDNGELEVRVHDEEQLGDLRRIIEKDGIIVEQVFQDKTREFVEFMLGEMEPEEREFFDFQNLKELLNSAVVIGESIRQNTQSNTNEDDNNNNHLIIEKLLQYIKERESTEKEFNNEDHHDADYEGGEQQQQQEVVFLAGDAGVVKLFYETVLRAEDQYSRRSKVSASGSDNSSNYTNKNHENSNSMNSEQSRNCNARRNEQKKAEAYELESEKMINQQQSQVTSSQVSTAISQFLGDDHALNASKDTTGVTLSLTTVESSSVIANPSNSSVVFAGNTYQMRVFQASEFQELCQIFQKHKKLTSTGLVQIDKILAIQPAQPVSSNTQNNNKNNIKNNNNNNNSNPQGTAVVNEVQYGVLRDFKQWSLREIIDQGLFFSVYQQINLTIKITAALDKIHRNPSDQLSWHGNLKPSNILVDAQLNVYFADCSVEYSQLHKYSGEEILLSSVKHLEQALKEQFILGNPSLPLAECSRQLSQQFAQRKNDMIQQMADLHNLGVCLYELFTNREFRSEQYFQNVQLRGQVKRMAQESPTHVLHLIFTALHQLLEMQVTSAQELNRMFMEILRQL